MDIGLFSSTYDVRKLCMDDVEMIYAFCKRHTQYYAYCGKDASIELIENDLNVTPPGIAMDQKYYVGFFERGEMIAVLDLIDGYPEKGEAFIGFFMVNHDRQGRGVGSRIIADVLEYLRGQGFRACRLGIDKDNPQSNAFWRKNGFDVIREVVREDGTILLAQKRLR